MIALAAEGQVRRTRPERTLLHEVVFVICQVPPALGSVGAALALLGM
jgi:hypothetical protein